ncbi:uncharacterized protein LOC133904331 isoform X2 [Phragmites australis]|uniref:uncharacterized protein LOC133904331 isoform X2 n=1 Tax=Phragmites australis TaxID=29695 RepID=UPI002D78646E|nr:uncharacterized protein LOC133904331 isoform X2 [Phragmites australis]
MIVSIKTKIQEALNSIIRASIHLMKTMEISLSPSLLLASLVLLLFTWLHMRSASPRKNTNGHGRRISSPPSRPVVGHLHLLKKPLHHSLAALARRYGGGSGLLLLRFGAQPVLLVSSPAVADECFTVHDVALADRPRLFSRRLLTDDCPSIANARYGPLWRQLRRLATVHALCAHRLAATAATRDAEASAVAAKLWRAGPGAVSVKATAYEFVVNVIMAMVAGERMPEEQVRAPIQGDHRGGVRGGGGSEPARLLAGSAAAGLRENGEEAHQPRQGSPPVRPEPSRRVQASSPSRVRHRGDAEDGDRRPAPAAAAVAAVARRRGHPHRLPELAASRDGHFIQHDRVGDGSPAQQPCRAQESNSRARLRRGHVPAAAGIRPRRPPLPPVRHRRDPPAETSRPAPRPPRGVARLRHRRPRRRARDDGAGRRVLHAAGP